MTLLSTEELDPANLRNVSEHGFSAATIPRVGENRGEQEWRGNETVRAA